MSILHKLSVNTAKTVLTATALLAITLPEQAQAVNIGFSNVRINDIPLTYTPTGTGSNPTIRNPGGIFVLSFDAYDRLTGNTTPTSGVPRGRGLLSVSFFRLGGELPRPAETVLTYDGTGTAATPRRLSYTATLANGVFTGGFVADMLNTNSTQTNPDYDLNEPNGPFTVSNPQFNVTLDATPVPFEFSPGLGILALGACGALAQLNSFVRKLKPSISALSNSQ